MGSRLNIFTFQLGMGSIPDFASRCCESPAGSVVFFEEEDDGKAMAKKMRAVQVLHPNGPFELVQREVPEPKAGWVRGQR
jgi:hypothetical protein